MAGSLFFLCVYMFFTINSCILMHYVKCILGWSYFLCADKDLSSVYGGGYLGLVNDDGGSTK